MSIKILSGLGAELRSDEQVLQIFPSRVELQLYPPVENSTWAKGDVLALTLGASTKFDGTYDLWAWNPTSTASAGASVILPTAFTTPKAGRWISIFCECGGRGEVIG